MYARYDCYQARIATWFVGPFRSYCPARFANRIRENRLCHKFNGRN